MWEERLSMSAVPLDQIEQRLASVAAGTQAAKDAALRRAANRIDIASRISQLTATAPGVRAIVYHRMNASVHALLHFHGGFNIEVDGEDAASWIKYALKKRVSAVEWRWLLGIDESTEIAQVLSEIVQFLSLLEPVEGIVQIP